MTTRDAIATAIESYVDAGELAGAATLIWRDGAVIHAGGVGWRDVEARLPVERDTIFRLASMTKPVTCVAALALVEQGLLTLDDPVSRWAPELAHPRVLLDPDGPLGRTEPARRPITVRDLLTHRSGLTYGSFHPGPLADAYLDALGSVIDSALTPDEWIARLATLPLLDQPGTAFRYGHSTDLLGLVLGRAAGAPFAEVLRQLILDPLGMHDTGFTVPRDRRHRRAGAYGFDADGRLTKLATFGGGAVLPERPDDLTYESGGGGLWSTVDDYLAFARLFVERGTVDGVRILRPETVELMTTDHLTAEQRAAARLLGRPMFATGHGFGLGVAVVTDADRADPLLCGGGLGSVGWPGAYGGWWQADPGARSVLVFLCHNMVELEQLSEGVGLAAYIAGAEFQELASRPGPT